MELENIPTQNAEQDQALIQIASRIRPLPEDVEPSPEFLHRTRLQLLKLPREQTAQQQAA